MQFSLTVSFLFIAIGAVAGAPSANTTTGPSGIQELSDFHNFGASCSSISLSQSGDDPILSATCRRNDGSTDRESIGLNSCVTNSNGNIGCQLNGNLGASCEDCSLSGTTLFCICRQADGALDGTSLDLNNCLGNENGVLTCN